MIVREATDEDLPALAQFTHARLVALGYKPAISTEWLQDQRAVGYRLMALWDQGMIAAVLGGRPFDSADGPGYNISLFLANPDHPNPLKALDAVAFYSCNIAMSEGRPIVTVTRDLAMAGLIYGRDYAGMKAQDAGHHPITGETTHLHSTGDATTITKAILVRRPEWVLSL